MIWPTKKLGRVEKSKVYLIGVNHAVQWNNDLQATEDFKNYLSKQIKRLQIKLVAEEFSEQAFKQNGVDNTTTGIVAEQLSIKHVLCDPDEETREKICYPTRKQLQERFGVKSAVEGTDEYKARKEYERSFWPVREQYWISQIRKETFGSAIFIYGLDHSERFPSLLSKSGYDVTILESFNPTQ